MNCCTTSVPADRREERETVANEISCRNCGGRGRPVSRKTVLLMLKPHLLEIALQGTYRFCATRNCPVVYFEESGDRVFIGDDLRVVVGSKVDQDPIPLCYCFGFNQSHIRDEILRNGRTTIPETISRLIREGFCACEARNPAGVCCLGEVKRAVQEFGASAQQSELAPGE
jgi:Zinc binding domain